MQQTLATVSNELMNCICVLHCVADVKDIFMRLTRQYWSYVYDNADVVAVN